MMYYGAFCLCFLQYGDSVIWVHMMKAAIFYIMIYNKLLMRSTNGLDHNTFFDHDTHLSYTYAYIYIQNNVHVRIYKYYKIQNT